VNRRELVEGFGRLGALVVVGFAAVIGLAFLLARDGSLSFSQAFAESLGAAAGLLGLAGALAWTRTGRFERTRDAMGRRTLVERTPEERRRRERLCLGLFGAAAACFVLSIPFA